MKNVNLLLDTHAMLWFLEGDFKKLSEKSCQIVEEVEKFVSMVSLWEIAVKKDIRKLKLKSDFNGLVELIESNAFKILNIQFSHLQRSIALELHHRNPFDRLLIAQAIEENLQVVTKDPSFSSYPIKTIW